MTRRGFLKMLGAGAAALSLPAHRALAAPAARPNILYILADDLGYGDLRCLNPDSKITTPNMDRLAAGGMIFTDAHSSSAVCSPTRYGILTGRYNWRSRLKSGVLGGFSPRLIEEGRLTVPAFLKRHGYTTACFGKWHLGMDWPLKEGGIAQGYDDGWKVDYAKPVANGPTALGFDTYFGISASLDMPPYVFIENDRATEIPTTEKTWIRKGPAGEKFEAIDVLPALTRKTVEFLNRSAAAAKSEERPFFVYMPLSAPHTPILPTAEWQDKSGLNPYGDFTQQVDASVGEVLAALDRNGLADNTLVILTSDNGCSPAANTSEMESKRHFASYRSRGYKADIYDGGHHIPFIARWPGRVKPGSKSDQIICLTDLMATVAEILGERLPDNAGEDSVSILLALEARDNKPLHEAVVHHSINGSFAIRQANWKLELCPDSGGWSSPKPNEDTSHLPAIQLYDLASDIAEKNNVQDKHPDVVARLTKLLEKYVAQGRSTPGAPQENTTPVEIWKSRPKTGQPKAASAKKAQKANKKKAASQSTEKN